MVDTSWIQVISLFVANAVLFFLFRSESRNDWHHMDAQFQAIKDEIKEFHGRLCSIEERNREKR